MRSSFELLSNHMQEYGPVCYIHNPEICHFQNCTFLSSKQTATQPENLYILRPDGDRSLLGGTRANYLVLDSQYAPYDTLIPSSSNVIVLTRFTKESEEKLYTAVKVCCEALRRLDAQTPQLLQACLLAEDGMETLLKISAEILGNPLAIVDSDSQILSHDASVTDDEARHLLPDRTRWKAKMEKETDGDNYSLKDVIDNIDYVLVQKSDRNEPCIMTVIQVKQFRMYGLTSAAFRRRFRSSDVPLLFLIAGILSDYMSLHSSRGKLTRNTLIKNFLIDILSNKLKDRELIEQKAQELDIRPEKYNYLLLLFRSDKKTVSHNDILAQYARISHQTTYFVCIYANQILMLVSSKTDINDFTKCGTGIDFANLSREPLNTAIVSLSISELEQLYDTYVQCHSVQANISGTAKKNLLNFKDYLYQGSINRILHTNARKDFSIPTAERIISYDQENATAYAATILQYLKHYMKIKETAAALHVHKNSVIYRIRRSTELFDINYSDHAALNALALSLEILLHDMPNL